MRTDRRVNPPAFLADEVKHNSLHGVCEKLSAIAKLFKQSLVGSEPIIADYLCCPTVPLPPQYLSLRATLVLAPSTPVFEIR